jgi:hypothetical protein
VSTPAVNPAHNPWPERWQRFSATTVRAFHRYASWLVSISWKRFFLLSVLLLIAVNILASLPPFSLSYTETISEPKRKKSAPVVSVEKPKTPASGADQAVVVRIGGREVVRIEPAAKKPAGAASAAKGSEAKPPDDPPPADDAGVTVTLPPGADSDAVLEAIRDAAREARDALREAASEGPVTRVRRVEHGDFLIQIAALWILGSAIIKFTYKGQMRAEAIAAKATEAAEAESLKRQVVEARMAAMQAQVEPHFLFNTLASIDHLIETDPARASQMQKNLIALLRASMPTMREASDGGVRDLARELAVIRPYLEILKVRMEDRLSTSIDVPEGLHSAEFPPMMIQTLVENAIKHGLEPKPEGGSLAVRAEIIHGKLAVSVADTGLGFGRAPTAGTGVGLANIRERLRLLYGERATLTVAENRPSGTVVTVTVPYKSLEGEGA